MAVHDWDRVPPNVFHHFHTSWLAEICSSLNRGILPEDYFAALEQTAGEVIPDILTLRTSDESQDGPDGRSSPAGAVAVAQQPPKVDLTLDADSFLLRQKRIVIRHTLGDVVALIELVSPENKRTIKSLDRLRTKVLSAIDQRTHVVILDILPPRKHDPHGIHGVIWDELSNIPYEAAPGRPLTLVSYEADDITRAYVQPIAVGSELPPMPVFLTPGWYVDVPLEETYQQAWEGMPRPWRTMLTE